MRLSDAAQVLLILSVLLLPGQSIADCDQYGDYLHWAGHADIPGYAQGSPIPGIMPTSSARTRAASRS
jgi:hypothetical protein